MYGLLTEEIARQRRAEREARSDVRRQVRELTTTDRPVRTSVGIRLVQAGLTLAAGRCAARLAPEVVCNAREQLA
jgi:hypothetical protein